MTMEIYICGSLINAGVYATTVDAAGHGFAITLVNDCCGYSSEARQIKAIEALQALTGCGFSASTKIVKDDSPNQAGVDKNSSLHGDEIVQSMSALTLKNATTAPQAAEPDARGELREAVDNAQHQIGTIPTDISPEDTAINKFHDHRAPMNRSKSGDMSEGQEGQQLRGLCEGDTDVIENLLPIELESGIFEILRDDEVQWQRMSHQGGEVPRLVAVQGEVGSDGSMPVYRHPSDESPPLLPFSSTVLAIKAVTEKQLGHPLNHVLIQFYQNGKDYISEHSDKTLDIMRDSYIANGATAKCLDNAKDVINGQTEESISMLRAFGTENHSSDFDWNAHYGKGFDVLHLRGAPRLFLSTDSIVNMKISMMLAFYEIGYASGSISQSQKSTSQHIDDERGAMEDVFIKYVDNDDDKTEVSGDLAIMLYLHANYQKKKGTMTSGELAKQFTLFQNSISLLRRWRDILKIIGDSETLIITLNAELKPWEAWASDTDCIGGNRPNLVDFALWPVLYSMVERCGNETFTDLIALRKYYDTMKTRSSTMKMLNRLQQAQ
ncbi:isochorismatase family protein family [Cordyceps javanica]|nr:isochorismatase family protein family [Cordyceps javanica]